MANRDREEVPGAAYFKLQKDLLTHRRAIEVSQTKLEL
jgi:hypothetical protein